MTVPISIDLITQACAELQLSSRVRRRVREFYSHARATWPRHSQAGLVAGSIYVAALLEGEPRTNMQVAEKLCVTNVTVGKSYQLITRLEAVKKLCERKKISWVLRQQKNLIERVMRGRTVMKLFCGHCNERIQHERIGKGTWRCLKCRGLRRWAANPYGQHGAPKKGPCTGFNRSNKSFALN